MSDLPNPKTRNEKFLNAIATGDSADLPTPKTRNEKYLKYIAENNTTSGGGGTGSGLSSTQIKNINSIPNIITDISTLKKNKANVTHIWGLESLGEDVKTAIESNGLTDRQKEDIEKINVMDKEIKALKDKITENNNGNNEGNTINTTPNLKLGYNNIIATGQSLTLPTVANASQVGIVKLFVNVQELGNKVIFNDEDIIWSNKPNFDKVGIYRIELEKNFNVWLGNVSYFNTDNPKVEIAETLKQNGYEGHVQVVEVDFVDTKEKIAIMLDDELSGCDKVKVYYYIDKKFYWLNSVTVKNGQIGFKTNGAGVYFITTNTAPIFDKNAMELVYQDTFNQDGDIDHTRWEREVHEAGWTNEELQYYTDKIANSYIEDGKLIIKAIKEQYGNAQYTSARLASKTSWLYGKFEIKAKLPTGNGMWPAIWLMPKDSLYGEWPQSGEIDIMENVGKEPEWIHGSLHSSKYNFRNGNQVTAKTEVPTNSSEYHTYGAIWTPEYIEFLVDDVSYLKHSYDSEKEPSKWEVFPYDKPYYLLLNVAVGGNWGGEVDDAILPQTMCVESVKVYDLGFNRYDKTQPDEPTGVKFLDNVISWDYCYDNVAVKEYKVALDNGTTLTTSNNYIVLNPIDTIGATSGSISAIDCAGNSSSAISVKITPPATEIICNENKPIANDWTVYCNAENSSATATQGENGIVLNIANGGSDAWDIQLMKNNIKIAQNTKYAYSLTLTSTTDRNVKIAIQNQNNYQGIAYNDIYLDANKETALKGEFTYTGEDIITDFVLQLGNDTKDYSDSKIYLNKFVFAKILK